MMENMECEKGTLMIPLNNVEKRHKSQMIKSAI